MSTAISTARIFDLTPPIVPPPRNGLTVLAKTFVWLAIATSAIVFTEPAPTDALTIGLVGLLPMLGLVRIRPLLVVFLLTWLVVVAGMAMATIFAFDVARSSIHTGITLYLVLAAFVLGGFVARDPARNLALILNAYLMGALLAATIGIIGYFDLIAGAGELFTLYERATATFKDPNVFGPFLVPALIYTLHLLMTRPLLRSVWPAMLCTYLAFALVLSFSRGAWINFAISAALYIALALATSSTNLHKMRILSRLFVISTIAILVLIAALQVDTVAKLFDARLVLFQTYDVGPEGRFGGQWKAVELIFENMLGIGSYTFTLVHHHEDVHNVYLAMLLNGGWLGGLVYAGLVLVTLAAGLVHACKRTSMQPLYLVVYAAFAGVALEGFIVDTDHWRHFFLLQGIVWGLMSLPRKLVRTAAKPQREARLVRAVPVPFALAYAKRPPTRRPRITGIARRRLPRHIAIPRRIRGQQRPRRRSRIAYRSASNDR